MAHVLCCTDGSIYSPSVYGYSAWAAQRLKAGVHILHMLEHVKRTDSIDASGTIGVDSREKLMKELVELAEAEGKIAQAKAQAILTDAKSHLQQAGVEDIGIHSLHGYLVDALEQFEATAEMVVLGKRGEHADFAKLHLGSNVERIIRSCHKPVLVASRAFQPVERFLIAYDGGPTVERAIRYVLGTPLLKGLRCHIIRAGKIDDDAEWFLQETAEKLRNGGFNVTAEAVEGDPKKVIARFVEANNIGLLVMGAYGHSRVREFLVGSTTTEMIRKVRTPILMFR